MLALKKKGNQRKRSNRTQNPAFSSQTREDPPKDDDGRDAPQPLKYSPRQPIRKNDGAHITLHREIARWRGN
jgi:hypothetical protein